MIVFGPDDDGEQDDRTDEIPLIGMTCRFCGCNDSGACAIPIRFREDDLDEERPMIVFGPIEQLDETIEYMPCSWLIPNVCTAPECVEMAYREMNSGTIDSERKIIAA